MQRHTKVYVKNKLFRSSPLPHQHPIDTTRKKRTSVAKVFKIRSRKFRIKSKRVKERITK